MIRIGVMGFGGRISSVINDILRDVDPDVRVCGIIDPDEAGARSRLADCDKDGVTFYKSLDQLMRKERPDALAVGTRCNLHTPYAIQAARYDVPLYLEKPVAISMKQAVSLEKAFEKTRCQVVVSFPLRVSPLCVLARDYLSKNAAGELVHISAVNYVPYGAGYWEAEYRNYGITGGLFLQKATHDLDYMSYLMDSPIVRVAAMATYDKVFGGKKRRGLTCAKCKETLTCLESPENRKRAGLGGGEDHNCLYSKDCGDAQTGRNEDCSSALVEFASGAHGVYTQVFYVRRDAGARGATVSGYLGTVSFDWYANELKRVRHHAPFSAVERADSGMSHFGGDAELAHDFIGLIKGTAKTRTPIDTGIQSVYACLAARESSTIGKFVKVRQVGT